MFNIFDRFTNRKYKPVILPYKFPNYTSKIELNYQFPKINIDNKFKPKVIPEKNDDDPSDNNPLTFLILIAILGIIFYRKQLFLE
jgi:hypothetical protein